MTIKEAGKDVVINGDWFSYDIGFINKDNENDETELDSSDIEELDTLWKSLCSEFNCEVDSVTYIGSRNLEPPDQDSPVG